MVPESIGAGFRPQLPTIVEIQLPRVYKKNPGSEYFGGMAGGPGPRKIGQNRLWRGYLGPFMS